jgi:hypothetical protein
MWHLVIVILFPAFEAKFWQPEIWRYSDGIVDNKGDTDLYQQAVEKLFPR